MNLLQALQDAYINGFPIALSGLRTVGEEREMPAVYLNGQAGNTTLLWDQLSQDGWHKVSPYKLESDDRDGWQATLETGFHNVELISPPRSDLHCLAQESKQVTQEVVNRAAKTGLRLLTYGAQPLTPASKLSWLDDPRYTALRKSLCDAIDAILTTASQQCQVDVTRDEAVSVFNALNGLSGLLISLFCHTPVHRGKISHCKAVRERAYDSFLGADDRHGIAPFFSSLEEWFDYLVTRRLLFFQQGDDQRHFIEYKNSLAHFLSNGYKITQSVAQREMQSLESTLWFEARLRWRDSSQKTVETRCACPQMPGEHTVSAVSLGLIENLDATTQLLRRLSHEQWREIRQLAIKYGLNFSYKALGQTVQETNWELIKLAEEGLKKRKLGEETLLDPVKDRLERNVTLADQAIEIFRQGGVKALVASRAWPPTT